MVQPPKIETTPLDELPAIRPATGVAAIGEVVGRNPTTGATTLRRTLSRNELPALPAGTVTTSPGRHRLLPFCDLVHRCSMLTTAILITVYIGEKANVKCYQTLCLDFL